METSKSQADHAYDQIYAKIRKTFLLTNKYNLAVLDDKIRNAYNGRVATAEDIQHFFSHQSLNFLYNEMDNGIKKEVLARLDGPIEEAYNEMDAMMEKRILELVNERMEDVYGEAVALINGKMGCIYEEIDAKLSDLSFAEYPTLKMRWWYLKSTDSAGSMNPMYFYAACVFLVALVVMASLVIHKRRYSLPHKYYNQTNRTVYIASGPV